MIKGDKHIKNNVRKRDFRAHVINVGREEFSTGLPGYYMSLTGTFVNEYGKILKNSEIWFGLKLDLFDINKVVSVDHDKSVVDRNNLLIWGYKKKKKQVSILGDIKDIVQKFVREDKTISYLVLDFMRTPEAEMDRIYDIFKALTMQKEKCVVLMNFIVRERRIKYNPKLEDLHNRLSSNIDLKKIFKLGEWKGWKKPFIDYQFISQPSRTKMKTLVLIKD